MSWDALYAWIVCQTGWTWETVRWEMDFPRLDALTEQWRTLPPVHYELARIGAHFGVPRPEPLSSTNTTPPKDATPPKFNPSPTKPIASEKTENEESTVLEWMSHFGVR